MDGVKKHMVIVNDLKPGSSFISNGNIYQVINTQLNKTAMRQMIVKVKVKNLRTGVINEMSFTGGDKVEQAVIDRKQMQYLYDDGTSLVFMDNETYDQIEIPKDKLQWEMQFMKPNSNRLSKVIRQRLLKSMRFLKQGCRSRCRCSFRMVRMLSFQPLTASIPAGQSKQS